MTPADVNLQRRFADLSRRWWPEIERLISDVVDDGTAQMGVTFFGQYFLNRQVRSEQQVVLRGQTSMFQNRIQMTNPEVQYLEADDLQEQRHLLRTSTRAAGQLTPMCRSRSQISEVGKLRFSSERGLQKRGRIR